MATVTGAQNSTITSVNASGQTVTASGASFSMVLNGTTAFGDNSANLLSQALAALTASAGVLAAANTTLSNSTTPGAASTVSFDTGNSTQPAVVNLTLDDTTAAVGTLPANVSFVVDNSAAPLTLTGTASDISGAPPLYVGAGVTSDLTFNTGTAMSGTAIADGAKNLIGTPTSAPAGTSWNFVTGDGNDTVVAFSGNNSVSMGDGNNLTGTTGGNDTVSTVGNDTIILGDAATTVNVTGVGTALIGAVDQFGKPTTGKLTFVSNSSNGSTVFGGAGSDSINLGVGGGFAWGGSTGNNVLQAIGAATLFAGGNNDLLSVSGSAGHDLQAGSGNVTLNATGSTGNDTVLAGMGATTVNAGSGSDVFAVLNGYAGGTVDIFNFNANDIINDIGYNYGTGAPTTTVAGSVTTITLTDNTIIRLQGYTGTTNIRST